VRFVVYGAGAVGGVVASRLYQRGEDVVLIARGGHGERLRSDGVLVRDPSGEVRLAIPTVGGPAEIAWRDTDIVLVSVKSHQSEPVLSDLAATAPPHVAVVSLQNGVRNEPEALRRFTNVYGVAVACPCSHLEAGVVEAYSSPCTGILDVGRYPDGVDETASKISAAFERAGFDSRPVADIARWKWRKLVTNLGNAVEAVCGPPARRGPVGEMATAEGEACLAAANIDAVSTDEDQRRRGTLLALHPVAGRTRPGGSTWQSLARGAHSLETDYLNGEVVLLGRLHKVATPVNHLLQRLANDLAARGGAPGSVQPQDFLTRVKTLSTGE
jgi:2-dehydropantoate 2-reductase